MNTKSPKKIFKKHKSSTQKIQRGGMEWKNVHNILDFLIWLINLFKTRKDNLKPEDSTDTHFKGTRKLNTSINSKPVKRISLSSTRKSNTSINSKNDKEFSLSSTRSKNISLKLNNVFDYKDIKQIFRINDCSKLCLYTLLSRWKNFQDEPYYFKYCHDEFSQKSHVVFLSKIIEIAVNCNVTTFNISFKCQDNHDITIKTFENVHECYLLTQKEYENPTYKPMIKYY